MGDRKKFTHNGQTVYEWEQNMNEVLIFVKAPQGVTARMIECKITKDHLTLGIKGNNPFINVSFRDFALTNYADLMCCHAGRFF
mmetsp:Transcript_6677/g.14905  ORF Transcript_6677/g.14905 Transcript_6677/m.14905 type:complete len:84 (-) Transcript_6677:501-752(-)